MEPLLAVTGLRFVLRDRPILDGVSFDIRAGEYIAVIGPNGAGKTTLLRHLNRIIRSQQTGSVHLLGRPIEAYTQRAIARHIAFVAQTPVAIRHFTVREFLYLGRYPHLGPFASPTAADDRAVAESLALTDTMRHADRDLVTLSGGELQKVFIAAGLAQGGEVILLDEPATFLDPRHQHEIFTILQKVNAAGRAVVTVTHDINIAVLTSTRVLALRDGRVAYDGPSAGVMDNAVLEPVYGRAFRFAVHPDTGNRIAIPEVYLGREGGA
ncbi:MAG: ABC transporter ATP-binding protein [Planctomycetota bacterium]